MAADTELPQRDGDARTGNEGAKRGNSVQTPESTATIMGRQQPTYGSNTK